MYFSNQSSLVKWTDKQAIGVVNYERSIAPSTSRRVGKRVTPKRQAAPACPKLTTRLYIAVATANMPGLVPMRRARDDADDESDIDGSSPSSEKRPRLNGHASQVWSSTFRISCRR